MKKFVQVGGIWQTQKGYSIRLNNGMFFGIFKNDNKDDVEKAPDWNITLDIHDARKLGLLYKKAHLPSHRRREGKDD